MVSISPSVGEYGSPGNLDLYGPTVLHFPVLNNSCRILIYFIFFFFFSLQSEALCANILGSTEYFVLMYLFQFCSDISTRTLLVNDLQLGTQAIQNSKGGYLGEKFLQALA